MAAGDIVKKYVGIAGDALANVWQALRAEREAAPEAEPPVGARDEFGRMPGAVMGIPIGTIALIAAAYFLFKGR